MDKREVTSSGSKDYTGRSGNGVTNYLTLSTNRKNNKHKSRTAIDEITNQYFSKLLKKFKNLPYLGYKKKQVHNEPTESHLFPIKQVSKLIKIKKHVPLCTKRVQPDIDGTKCDHETIEHAK